MEFIVKIDAYDEDEHRDEFVVLEENQNELLFERHAGGTMCESDVLRPRWKFLTDVSTMV